ncbi:MAG: carboxypeptidase-like regulatory domain-containing protein [Isosphaeraceae bacterium]
MLWRSAALLAIVIPLAWAVQSRADEKPSATPVQTGAVTGLVADLQGRPVAGAEVWGVAYQKKYSPSRSGADGWFRLPGLAVDRPVTIWAEAPGLARERRDDVRIFPGKDRDIGRLVLLPGSRMVGRLVDAQRKPVPKAHIKLELFRHQLGHTITCKGTEWTFRAAGDGRFATSPLPAGSAHFSFGAAGKVRTFVGKTAEPGKPVIDLGDVALPDEIPVAGVVVDQDGKPAPGVEVVADYDWDHSVKSDRNGRFTVHGVGKNIKILQLQSNDYFSPKPFDVAPGRTDLKLTVIKAYEIHGTAVDAETGKPVPIDTVRLCRVMRDPEDGHVSLVG